MGSEEPPPHPFENVLLPLLVVLYPPSATTVRLAAKGPPLLACSPASDATPHSSHLHRVHVAHQPGDQVEPARTEVATRRNSSSSTIRSNGTPRLCR